MRVKIMAVLGKCAQSNSTPDRILERREVGKEKKGMV
jgi:hypothetical protein